VLETAHPAEVLEFPTSYHLVPGFIDMHTHGANGHDVMDATPEALLEISKTLAREGTTSFLATTMTAEVEKITAALLTVSHFIQQNHPSQGAKILGVHLEGPFLASTKMGAQAGDKIILPSIELVKQWQDLANNVIKLVTLAPEQKGSLAFIHFLKKNNIIASLGHTDATYAESQAAIAAGCSHATHLFNAMRGLHHREPGAVTAALLADDVMAELILDGFHLHPAIVELALRVKGKERIILVTDAMRAKCLQAGSYDLGGQTVNVKDGQARLANGTLAGSVLQMSAAIKNMLAFTACELSDVLPMVSVNPAKALGIFDKKGSIALHKEADLVVLSDKLEVVLTLSGGHKVFTGAQRV
jgi:N-acetylglucosamine-6-phosphate deacetylase